MACPKASKSFPRRIWDGLKEGLWKLLLGLLASKIWTGILLLGTLLVILFRPIYIWLGGLSYSFVEHYWPPQEIFYFTVGGTVAFAFILGVVVSRRTRARREDPVELANAKRLIQDETRSLTHRAKKRDPKARAVCAPKGWLADTRRDRICRRTFCYGSMTWVSYSIIIFLAVKDSFAVTPKIRWKKNVKPGSCVVVIRRQGHTVAFGIVDDVGKCDLEGLASEGEIQVLVYRLGDDAIEWSEMTTDVSKARSEVYIDFPKYRCPLKVYGPFMVPKNGDRVISADVSKVRDAQREIGDLEGLVVIEGRTCDEEFPSWDGRTNYSLSLKRCEGVSSMLDTTSREKRIVLPLKHDLPLNPQTSQPSSEERSRERNARILVLMRSLADDM